MNTRLLCIMLIALAFSTPVNASVVEPNLGFQLVEQPNRKTLIIDLCAPGVELRATRYEEKKQTAESWGNALGLQAAVNGDFFDFPAATLVLGRAMGDWEWWPWGTAWVAEQSRPYWQMGPGWAELVESGYDDPSDGTRDIVGAHNTLMSQGVVLAPWVGDELLLNGAHKRTAYGLSATRRKMFWTVVHVPVTGVQLVNHMIADAQEAGAPPPHWISNQDGGGSAQLWLQSQGFVLPSTRKVANHLGAYALGWGEPAYNCAPVTWEGTYVESSYPLTVPDLWSFGTVQLKWGESTTGTITFTNTGTASWTPGITTLAPTPVDEPHPLASDAWLSPTRIGTVTSTVQSGEDHVFTLPIHGGTPGTHTLSLGLVEEGVAWFHDETVAGGPPLGLISIEVVVSEEPFCTSNCNQKECGNDGCGGSCGGCPVGTTCDGGVCVCIPACGSSVCGGDGCGGNCGSCAANENCVNGACECAPFCGGSSCGSDGCGGTCGSCPAGTACAGGQCACVPSCESLECGPDGCGGSCGECVEPNTCIDGSCACIPDCGPEECGPDGCGGSCGPCADSDVVAPEDTLVDSGPDATQGEDAHSGEDAPDQAEPASPDADSPAPTDDGGNGTVFDSSNTEEPSTNRENRRGSRPQPGAPAPMRHQSSAADSGCQGAGGSHPARSPLALVLTTVALAWHRPRKANP